MTYKICGAKNRQGTPCRRPSGWGTDHAGEGRCKLHGGKNSGPPKGNKNALKTGEYEAIWIDTLDEEEQQLYPMISQDLSTQIEEELKLLTIRERRMLVRIDQIQTASKKPKLSEKDLALVQSIEEGLTRIQDKKTRLLDLKHKVSAFAGDEEGHDNIEGLTLIIAESKKLLSKGKLKAVEDNE